MVNICPLFALISAHIPGIGALAPATVSEPQTLFPALTDLALESSQPAVPGPARVPSEGWSIRHQEPVPVQLLVVRQLVQRGR